MVTECEAEAYMRQGRVSKGRDFPVAGAKVFSHDFPHKCAHQTVPGLYDQGMEPATDLTRWSCSIRASAARAASTQLSKAAAGQCGGESGILLPPLPASADETYTSVIITSVYAGCKQNPLMYFRALPSTVGTMKIAKNSIS